MHHLQRPRLRPLPLRRRAPADAARAHLRDVPSTVGHVRVLRRAPVPAGRRRHPEGAVRPGLRRALRDARQRGAEEGTLDAARSARRSLVRRTALPEGASPRAAMMARALAELDVYDQEGGDR